MADDCTGQPIRTLPKKDDTTISNGFAAPRPYRTATARAQQRQRKIGPCGQHRQHDWRIDYPEIDKIETSVLLPPSSGQQRFRTGQSGHRPFFFFFAKNPQRKPIYMRFLPHVTAVTALAAKFAMHNPSIIPYDPSIIPHNPSIIPHNPSIIPHNPSIIPHNPSITYNRHVNHIPAIAQHFMLLRL
jgi:hypothetical protein